MPHSKSEQPVTDWGFQAHLPPFLTSMLPNKKIPLGYILVNVALNAITEKLPNLSDYP